jgi:hypothetical protein
MERRNLRSLYRMPWREIPCRRKLLNTTGRHQNTSSMPPTEEAVKAHTDEHGKK